MNNIEIRDELFDLNAMLEVCHGYTQSDDPDMGVLGVTLFVLHTQYSKLYKEMRKEGGAV